MVIFVCNYPIQLIMGGMTLKYVLTYVLEGAEYCFGTVQSVVQMNYEVVTATLRFFKELFNVLYYGVSLIFTVLYNILSSGVDFLNECCNFVYGFLLLIWKFLIFVASVLDLLFRGIEILAHFILTGGKWTADALHVSFTDFKYNSYNLYLYISGTLSEWMSISSGAFALVWTFTCSLIIGAFDTFKYAILAACTAVDKCMIGFAEGTKYLTDKVYYFLIHYLPNIPKETYLGLVTVLLLYLFVIGIINHLSNRGMTFPILSHLRNPPVWGEDQEVVQFEFSDDDVNDSDVDSDNDSLSDNNDDDDLDEEEVEFEVADDSDDSGNSNASDDSDGTSTTLSNDIDIQLPPTRQGRYNLRRSTTPSNIKMERPEDFEREIEKERERQKCVVCQDQNKSVLILPCRHMCLCVECGNQIARARNVARRTCPLCRQKIRTIMDVYV